MIFWKLNSWGSLWGRNKQLHQVAHMAQENLHVARQTHTTPYNTMAIQLQAQQSETVTKQSFWIFSHNSVLKTKSPRTWKVICGGLRSISRRSSAKLDLNLSRLPCQFLHQYLNYILDSRLWVNVVEKCHWRIDERKLGWGWQASVLAA